MKTAKTKKLWCCKKLLATLAPIFFSIALVGYALTEFPTSAEVEDSAVMKIWAVFSFPAVQQKVVFRLLSTAYNSLESQTDSTPFITATGEQTQPGVIALSRDLLEEIPYGSIVEIVDVGPLESEPNGCGATIASVRHMKTLPGLKRGQFRVADTMHSRKIQQVDVWFQSNTDAINWGRCEVALVPITLAKGGS